MDGRPHPHINLATVTYLFAGAIDHRDSLGTLATIEPGAVNLMTAGSGIVHSERSPSAARAIGPELSGIQTWKIGRASCRARACQSVWIPVVAVSFKKTKIIHTA